MLDVALLTANASQLKYVLQVGEENHPFYTLMLTLIIISIILQVKKYNVKVCATHFIGLAARRKLSSKKARSKDSFLTFKKDA